MFSKKIITKDGLQYECKSCRAIYKLNNIQNNQKYNRQWRKDNRASCTAYNSKWRNMRICRTPKWVDAEELWLIAEVYDLAERRNKATNIKWHVDHIIPLQGRLVSGLHVISNLQVIPAKLNLSKGNKYDQT